MLFAPDCIIAVVVGFRRMFNSVHDHSCGDDATVTETNWWQVTWESRITAKSKPPTPCQTRKILLKQNSYSGQLTARYARLVEIMSRFQSVAVRAT